MVSLSRHLSTNERPPANGGRASCERYHCHLLNQAENFESRTKLDEHQDTNDRYSLDGLPGLITSRQRAGNSLTMDKAKTWGKGIWNGKLDAVFLGWLIGVVIAILNELFNRYGETIKTTVSSGVHKLMQQR